MWEVDISQRSHLRLSGRKQHIVIWRHVCRLWQLYHRENCRHLAPLSLCFFSTHTPLTPTTPSCVSLSLFHSFWLNAQGECVFVLSVYLNFNSLVGGWVGHHWQMPHHHLKRPLGIMTIDTVISRLLRKPSFFNWCYLSWSVLTPCNDDLSLFSVTCSIFIYDRASFFSLYFFGFITHSFVPYLQLMKKNKEKEYFMCRVIHSPQSSSSSLIMVLQKRSFFCTLLVLDIFVPTGLQRNGQVIPAVTACLN